MDPTIDIFSAESMFRDPIYEELGYIFDPERNEYYEIVEDPEYGQIRSYIPPRDIAVERSIEKSRVGRIYGPDESPFDNREVTVGDRVRDLLFQKQIERSDRLDEYERKQQERLKERERKRQSQSFQSGGAVSDIDIFRDPVYEQMGLIFDPERNQYYENIEDPRYGSMRSYISPRDQGPVPELSEARERADIEPDIARIAGQILSQAGPGVGSKPKGISDRSMSLAMKMAADNMAFNEGAVTDKSFQQLETRAREIIDRVKRGGAMIVPDAMNETFEQLRRSVKQDSKGFSSRGGMVSDKDMSRFRGIGSL